MGIMLFFITFQTFAIVRGQLVPPNFFVNNSLIKIEVKNHPEIFCTTVIINKNTLITAKHCVANDFLSNENFQLSIARFDKVLVNIQSIKLHPAIDLAFIKLAENIPGNFLPLSVIGFDQVDKHQLIIAGFGKHDIEQAVDGKLRYGVIENPSVKYNDQLISMKLSSDQPSACGGDSGGALIGVIGSMPYLVGIIDATDKLCEAFNGFIQPAYYLKQLELAKSRVQLIP